MDSLLRFCSIRSCFRLLRFAKGLANILNNCAFVIKFHKNYVRINDNQIRMLDKLRNCMSHFFVNVYAYLHSKQNKSGIGHMKNLDMKNKCRSYHVHMLPVYFFRDTLLEFQ